MMDALTGLAPLLASEQPQQTSKKDADPGKQVEVLFARMMVKEMRKAMPSDGPFGGKEMSMYMDLLDDVLSERIAESGNMGIAEQMNRTLLASDGKHLRSDTSRVNAVPNHQARHLRAPHRPTTLHHHGHQHDVRPAQGRISSTFGKRTDPINGTTRMHKGLDIAAAKGTPIRAARSGTVTFAGERGGYGLVVYVDHGDGLETRYAHCSKLHVKAGDTVSQGQLLSEVGSTGRSTGNHLHFEARKNGAAVDPDTIFNWSDEKSTKTQPQLVRQNIREGL